MKFIAFNHAYYVLLDQEGRVVGIDRDSGGEPYFPTNPNGIQFWTKHDAEKYMHAFRNSTRYRFTMHKVTLVL